MKTIIEAMSWRYAVKKFDPSRKISSEDWKELTEALRLSPSSYGLQPWRFLIIEDPELREKLKKEARSQSQVTDASHFIVFCLPKIDEGLVQRHISNIAGTRNVSLDSLQEYRQRILDSLKKRDAAGNEAWAQKQIYIALGVLLTAAAVKKIDTCPMEGIDKKAFDKILGLSENGLRTVVTCALGYRSAEDDYSKKKKVRFARDEVFVEIKGNDSENDKD